VLRTIPRPFAARLGLGIVVVAFFLFLFAPLVVVAVFAFNDGPAPSPPWRGFTWDWFVGQRPGRTGLLHDAVLLRGLGVSLRVALWVAALSVAVGTVAAFLLQRRFRGKAALNLVLLWPLVIPGVILGIAILLFTSNLANALEDWLQRDLDFLRPGLPLVVLGQFSFIATIATLIVGARLSKFDASLAEAARGLGAGAFTALRTVTLPYLVPALVGAGIVAFLMSFENFNTTLMLVGSDAPLTIAMYGRMREGTTPVINAVSLMLILASALLAFGLLLAGRRR
jgi:spermidine/putrescine transport system permease protein